jgi:hypothetical protein
MTLRVLQESDLWPALKIMSWLAPLEQDDPAAFRQVANRIAAGLTEAALQAASQGDSDEAIRCQQLAAIFQGILRQTASPPTRPPIAVNE